MEVKPERRTVRVYTEGESTEPEYIDALKRAPGIAEAVALDIRIVQGGLSPSSLVEHAREDKRRSNLDVDEFWCVFDVESPQPHADLMRAVDMARGNGIHLAISNPCFEIWLILHLQNHSAYLTTEEAVRLRAELDGSDGKHLDAALYIPRRSEAMRRAVSLRKKHLDDGTRFHEDNPSSTFDEFVTKLEQLAAGSLNDAKSSESSGSQTA